MAYPRAEFSSLPTELKSRIFELVANQEDAWRTRSKVIGGMDGSEEMTHVDGLVEASGVSKEWRSHAVKHLFSTVTAARARHPTFKYLILPKYAHHITQIEFEYYSAADAYNGMAEAIWDNLFSIIPLFQNLRSMTLDLSAANTLFGDDLEVVFEEDLALDDPQSMRVAALRGMAGRIDDLTLVNFWAGDAAGMLAAWPNLRRLRLQDLVEVTPIHKLGERLSNLSVLQTLDIQLAFSPIPEEERWPSEALASLREHPPPVSTLRLSYDIHSPTDFQFISIFASTLQHLDLTINLLADSIVPSTPSALPDPLPQNTLPNLSTLHLTFTKTLRATQPSSFSRLLPSFALSPLTSLVLRETEHDPINHEEEPSYLRNLGDQFPYLRHFSFGRRFAHLEPWEIAHSVAFCAKRNLSPPTATPFDNPWPFRVTDSDNDVLCDGLDQVLNFGKREVGRLRAGGNAADSAALLHSLRPLDAHRRRWQD
ncbi:hypothetical protein RQP46_009530 [Phenoliferia psychrophenolica]